jgi:hypothetical protein
MMDQRLLWLVLPISPVLRRFPLTEAFVATLATGNTVLYGDQAISFQSNDIQIDLLEGLSPNPSAGEGLRYMHDYTDYIIDFDRTIPDVGITKKLIKRGVSSPSGAEMRIVDDSDAYPFYENYPFNSGDCCLRSPRMD